MRNRYKGLREAMGDYCVGCDGDGGDCVVAKVNGMPLVACDLDEDYARSGALKVKCPRHPKEQAFHAQTWKAYKKWAKKP